MTTEPGTGERPPAVAPTTVSPRREPPTEPLPRVGRSTPAAPPFPGGDDDAAGAAAGTGHGGPPHEPARRRGLTVRTRILAVVVVATVAALALSGLTAALLTTRRVDARVDDDLTRSAELVRVLAADGVDPRTGAPFASAHDLVSRALQRTVPAPNAGMLAVEGGRVALVAADSVVVRPEQDAELVADLTRPGVADRPALRSVRTPTTTWRVAVVPVRAAAGADTSTFVLAYDRGAEQRDFSGSFAIYAAVATLAAALVAVVGWVVAGRLLRPVRDLGTTARAITRTDLTARLPVTGNDDVADLTRAFNAMLDRIEQAVDAQRALLDDVGHELRTPLTVVRGHLEVMDIADEQDVSETRELALDELDRMSRMVSDLMTLATAGSEGFVRREPADLGALADSVSGNVRPLGDRRWGVQERAEGTAVVDAQRLTQAWLQLAANAVKFSDPGSTVVLGSRVTDAGVLELWVRDEGVGIAPDDLDRVFTRFARAEEDDARPGAGLGLAIVAAIAHAHGGHVEVASLPGRGSTFTIRVPVEPPADDETDAETAPTVGGAS